MFIRNCFLFAFVFFCLFSCRNLKKVEDKPLNPITEKENLTIPFSSINDINLRKKLISLKKKEKLISYKAKISIVIQKFFPKVKKNKIRGFISFNHKNKKMKITLEDSFFGFKVAQIETDGSLMRIKAPKQKTISTKLGDIYLDEMNFHLPFKSIYFLLSNQNSTFFEQQSNNLTLENNQIILNTKNNYFSYYYNNKNNLFRVITKSKNHNLQSLITFQKAKTFTNLKIKTFNQTKILLVSLDIKIKKI